VPAADLADAALEAATEWATGATVAIGAAKWAINRGWGHDIEEGLAVEADAFVAAFESEDAVEGIGALRRSRAQARRTTGGPPGSPGRAAPDPGRYPG